MVKWGQGLWLVAVAVAVSQAEKMSCLSRTKPPTIPTAPWTRTPFVPLTETPHAVS